MKFLIDKSKNEVSEKNKSPLVRGQLLTPLTRRALWPGEFAIDNGAFGGFKPGGFARLLARCENEMHRCLFVTCPDVVGSGRRTLELWRRRILWLCGYMYKAAFVAQNGIEDLEIPWGEMAVLFIGGVDPWKDSKSCIDLVLTAKALGLHVHVGRVNTPKRYNLFAEAGADTCDGTGVSRYSHMLEAIENGAPPTKTLFSDKSPVEAAIKAVEEES